MRIDDDDRLEDPALRDLVVLTRNYRGTLIVVTLITAVVGAGLGLSAPRTYTGRAIIEPAEVAPEGAVENLEVSASRVETFIESQVVTEALAIGTKVDVVLVRDQPPSSMPVNLLALKATAPTTDAAEQALRLSIEELRKSQNPLYESELQRLVDNEAVLTRDLERLVGTEQITTSSHEAITQVIVDLSDTERRRHRIRTHPLEVLVGPTIEPTRTVPRVIAFGAIGFALGIAFAYFIAFVTAGLKAVRATE